MSALLKSDHVTDYMSMLQGVALFSGIQDNEMALQELALKMSLISYQTGDYICREGELGDAFYILVEGSISIFKQTPDGDLFKVAAVKGKDLPGIGEGGLIGSEARSATIQCDSPCTCVLLSREKFEEYIQKFPSWGLSIYKNIARALIKRLSKMNTDLMLLHKALTREVRG